MLEHNYGDLKIFQNKSNYNQQFYGCFWISYNNKYSTGFWQQITPYYTTINRLKRYNKQFKHIDF